MNKKTLKYPMEQSCLMELTQWRGSLFVMRDTASSTGLTELVTVLGPAIGVVERLIQEGLDPTKEHRNA